MYNVTVRTHVHGFGGLMTISTFVF